MRLKHTKTIKQADGSIVVQKVILASGLNLKTLNDKFGMREEVYHNPENEIDLILEQPKIYVCKGESIRKLVGAESGERVYVVKQTHRENFV